MKSDGERDLEATRIPGSDAGDPFPGTGGANNPNTVLDAFSFPNSRDYGGHDTGIAVRNISNSSAMMTADLLASRVPEVLNISPARNGIHVSSTSSILVTFSKALDPGSLNTSSFIVSGSVSGPRAGSFDLYESNKVVSFTPDVPFVNGEIVTVDLSDKVKSITGESIASHISQFTVASTPALATFKHRSILAGDYQYFRSLSVADLNGDGVPDLWAAGRDRISFWEGQVQPEILRCLPGQECLLGNSGRTYGQRLDSFVAGDTFSAQVADMDGDGDLDLIVGAESAVAVALNNGDGTFQMNGGYGVNGYGASHVVASDLDGDGDMDVATASGRWLSILRNNGDGTLQTPAVYYEMSEYANSIIAADLDNDGDIDLAASSSAAGLGRATVFTNCSNATFKKSGQYGLGNYTNTMLAADVDSDSDIDLVQIGCCGRFDGYFLRNNGEGAFGGQEWYGIWGNIGVAADLDGVGDIDLATLEPSTGSVRTLMNANDLPLSPPWLGQR